MSISHPSLPRDFVNSSRTVYQPVDQAMDQPVDKTNNISSVVLPRRFGSGRLSEKFIRFSLFLLLYLVIFCLWAGQLPAASARSDARTEQNVLLAQGSTSFGTANGQIFRDSGQGGQGDQSGQGGQGNQGGNQNNLQNNWQNQAPQSQTSVAPDGSQTTRSTTDTFIGQDEEGNQVIRSTTTPQVDDHSNSNTTIIVTPEIFPTWGPRPGPGPWPNPGPNPGPRPPHWDQNQPNRPNQPGQTLPGQPPSGNWQQQNPGNRPPQGNWQQQNPGNRPPQGNWQQPPGNRPNNMPSNGWPGMRPGPPSMQSPALPPSSQGELRGRNAPNLPPATQGELPGFNPRTNSRPSDGRPGQRPPGNIPGRPQPRSDNAVPGVVPGAGSGAQTGGGLIMPEADSAGSSGSNGNGAARGGAVSRGGAGDRGELPQLRVLQERMLYVESFQPDYWLDRDNQWNSFAVAGITLSGLLAQNQPPYSDAGTGPDPDPVASGVRNFIQGGTEAGVSGPSDAGDSGSPSFPSSQRNAPQSLPSDIFPSDTAFSGSAREPANTSPGASPSLYDETRRPTSDLPITNSGAVPPRSDSPDSRLEKTREKPPLEKFQTPERTSRDAAKDQPPPTPKEQPAPKQVFPPDQRLPKLKLRPYIKVPETTPPKTENDSRTLREGKKPVAEPPGYRSRGQADRVDPNVNPALRKRAGQWNAQGVGKAPGGGDEYKGSPADSPIQKGRVYSPKDPNATFDSGPRPTHGPLSPGYDGTPDRLRSGPDRPGGAGWSGAPRP